MTTLIRRPLWILLIWILLYSCVQTVEVQSRGRIRFAQSAMVDNIPLYDSDLDTYADRTPRNNKVRAASYESLQLPRATSRYRGRNDNILPELGKISNPIRSRSGKLLDFTISNQTRSERNNESSTVSSNRNRSNFDRRNTSRRRTETSEQNKKSIVIKSRTEKSSEETNNVRSDRTRNQTRKRPEKLSERGGSSQSRSRSKLESTTTIPVRSRNDNKNRKSIPNQIRSKTESPIAKYSLKQSLSVTESTVNEVSSHSPRLSSEIAEENAKWNSTRMVKLEQASRRQDAFFSDVVLTSTKARHRTPLSTTVLPLSDDQPTKIQFPTRIERNSSRKNAQLPANLNEVPLSTTERQRIRNRLATKASIRQTKEKPTEGMKFIATTVKLNWRDAAKNRGTSKPKLKEKEYETDGDDIEDENYPEHFKLLLQAKQGKRSEPLTTVKPNDATEPLRQQKNLFKPRRAEPYRPRSTKPEKVSTTTVKSDRKSDKSEPRSLYKPRINPKLQFPNLKTKSTTSSTEAYEEITFENEIQGETAVTGKPLKYSSRFVTEPVTYSKDVNGKGRSLNLQKTIKSDSQRKGDFSKNHAALLSPTPKYSSRYRGERGRNQHRPEKIQPVYTPTIPPVTTESEPKYVKVTNIPEIQFDEENLSGIWNFIDPIPDGLMKSEITVDTSDTSGSPVTVSIFGALSEILSKTTESLDFLTTSTTTTSTTTTSTTTTTTTTTEIPDILLKTQVQQLNEHKTNWNLESAVNKTQNENITAEFVDVGSSTNKKINMNIGQSVDISSNNSNESSSLLSLNPSSPSDTNFVHTRSNTLTNIDLLSENQLNLTLSSPILNTTQASTNISMQLSDTSSDLLIDNLELTTIATNSVTFPSNLPTSIPQPVIEVRLTTPGSDLITNPKFLPTNLDTSVKIVPNIIKSSGTNNSKSMTTPQEYISNMEKSDIMTTIGTSTKLPLTISLADLFTIKPKKIYHSTQLALDVHPIYMELDHNINSFGDFSSTPKSSIFSTEKTHNVETLVSTIVDSKKENYQRFKLNESFMNSTPIVPTKNSINFSSSTNISEFSNVMKTTSQTVLDSTIVYTTPISPTSFSYLSTVTKNSIHDISKVSPSSKTQYNKATKPYKTNFTDEKITSSTSPYLASLTNSILLETNEKITQVSEQTQTSNNNTELSTSPTRTVTQNKTMTAQRLSTNYLPITSPKTNSINNISSVITHSTRKTISSADTPFTSTTYRPRFAHRIPIQSGGTLTSTTSQPGLSRKDFFIYGILPNNTVVRKKPTEQSRPFDNLIVYGILPNQTVVRKYPNGTITSVNNSNDDLEIIDIDPRMLFNPFSEFYRTTMKSRVEGSSSITTKTAFTDTSTFTTSNSSTSPVSNMEFIELYSGPVTENAINSTTNITITENTLLDILKKKYINAEVPVKSSNVFSLTTSRNPSEAKVLPTKSINELNDSNNIASIDADTLTNRIMSDTANGWKNHAENPSENTRTVSTTEIPKRIDISSKRTQDNTVPDSDHSYREVINGVKAKGGTTPFIVLPETSTTKITTSTTIVPSTISTPLPTTLIATSSSTVVHTETLNSTISSTNSSLIMPTDKMPVTYTTTAQITAAPSTTTINIPIPISSTMFSTQRTTNTPSFTKNLSLTTTTPKTTKKPVKVAPIHSSATKVRQVSVTQLQQQIDEANQSSLERNLRLLQELLGLQATLEKTVTSTTPSTTIKTTTLPPRTTTPRVKSAQHSDAEDLSFLNNLRILLLGQPLQTTRKPRIQLTTTTAKHSSNIDDLLSSFQRITTPKPEKATTSDQEDIVFLNSLRQIAQAARISTTSAPKFANRIIELALNNRQLTTTTTTTTTAIPVRISPIRDQLNIDDIQRNTEDAAALSNDLQLLSVLLGRRLTPNDIPNLTKRVTSMRNSSPPPKPKSTTSTTINPNLEAQEQIQRDLRLLSSLLGRSITVDELPLLMEQLRGERKSKPSVSFAVPSTTTSSTTTTPSPRLIIKSNAESLEKDDILTILKNTGVESNIDLYGKTNEAVLAAILKQRGIGPTHNNIPINELFLQNPTPTPYTTTRATRRPKPPPRQPRPILDGLTWLWRTWQDTARPQRRPQPPRAPLPTVEFGPSGQGLDAIRGEQVSPTSNLDFNPGAGLLTAAIGVTRAVTQFLGTAFQGAAKSVQSVFAPRPSGDSGDLDYYSLSAG